MYRFDCTNAQKYLMSINDRIEIKVLKLKKLLDNSFFLWLDKHASLLCFFGSMKPQRKHTFFQVVRYDYEGTLVIHDTTVVDGDIWGCLRSLGWVQSNLKIWTRYMWTRLHGGLVGAGWSSSSLSAAVKDSVGDEVGSIDVLLWMVLGSLASSYAG